MLGSALGTAATAGRDAGRRRTVTVATVSSLGATAITGYLVRAVNLRLLDDGPPLAPDERRRLLGRWYTLNRIRLVLLAVATLGYERAAWNRRSR
ncbi:anthrone oxygenase family protein [Pseudonocardia sp. HH130630-07]|uniref:anthrone oxygenase family protein n=1 Tax=Pseudonocardia sp. HH130630-07 TaxID=1690815 RepID=UPI0008153BD2|nr:DUF1772 domain-containing protein [Pseudonocardia sp. HH130630-07]ANY07240.1 hypothetical protein AFB00_14185 [Pseudonocardia sp. HH130630-07]